MVSASPERLVLALEECAAALEEKARLVVGAVPREAGVPRLRRPVMGAAYAAGSPEFRAEWGVELDRFAAQLMEELAAECLEVAEAVRAGRAERGWVMSLAQRASRFVEAEEIARAALGFFG
jgi:hypothetical protein